MENKGFTLIELLGVLVLLTAMALIIIPTVDRALKQGKADALEQAKEDIVLAAKNWGADNRDLLPSTSSSCHVTLDTLMSGGYIDVDDTSDVASESNTNVKITNVTTSTAKRGTYTYEFGQNGDREC